MKDYIIERLCERSTWRGIFISCGSIIGMLIPYVNPHKLIIVSSIFMFLVSQIKIWTKDYKNTPSKLDDILYAFASAFTSFEKEKGDKNVSTGVNTKK